MSTKKWLLIAAAAAAATALLPGNLSIAGLFPFMFVLACPIAMWFMMKGIGGMGADHDRSTDGASVPVGTVRAAAPPPAREDSYGEPSVDPITDAQYRR